MAHEIEQHDLVLSCPISNVIDFQGVKSIKIRKILYLLLPLVLIAGAILGGLRDGFYGFKITFYITFAVATLITIWLFKEMMDEIPSTLNILWGRGILANNRPPSKSSPREEVSTQASLEEFTGFMKELESSLNSSRYQILFGLIFSVILLSGYAYEFGTQFHVIDRILLLNAGGLETFLGGAYLFINFYIASSLKDPLGSFVGFIVGPLIGFLLGLIAWRMIAIGVQISRVDKKFDLVPRLKDPDKCGGLEPLGNLCLHNAKILGVWGAFLVLWIIIGPNYANISIFIPCIKYLLALPFLLALASFFYPLWGVHMAMLEKKAEMGANLDQIARIINELARKRLNSACHLDHIGEEGKHLSGWVDDQEKLQNIYEESAKMPVWPINYQILFKLLTTQALPVLGLTGLGGPILDMIKSILDILSQSGGM
jgi:hypothetical protein